MKIKNWLLASVLILLINLPTNAQIAKMFVTKNDNGTTEYLLHHLKGNTFTYFSSAKPNGIMLEVKEKTNDNTQYTVSFPNSKEVYGFEISSDAQTTQLTCTNPNGTVQNFYNPMHTNCYQYGQGNAQETIFGIGPPIAYVYYAAKYPNGVLLTIVGGDMMTGIMKVSFPNSKQIYELESNNENILKCKNPDGSVQSFRIKK